MTYKTPNDTKKHHKCIKPESQQTASASSSFFFFFRWASLNIVWQFSHKTAAFYTDQCTSPSLFHKFEVSQGTSNLSLKNYDFICDPIFFTCMHEHKEHINEM